MSYLLKQTPLSSKVREEEFDVLNETPLSPRKTALAFIVCGMRTRYIIVRSAVKPRYLVVYFAFCGEKHDWYGIFLFPYGFKHAKTV